MASDGFQTLLPPCAAHFLCQSGVEPCRPSAPLWPIRELQIFKGCFCSRQNKELLRLRTFPANGSFFPGGAHVRLSSCSRSLTLPTIITVELQHKHLAALATCKENVTFVYLRLKHAEPLIFQLQSTSPGKIELSQEKETQSIPLDGFNKVKVNSVTCGGTSAES